RASAVSASAGTRAGGAAAGAVASAVPIATSSAIRPATAVLRRRGSRATRVLRLRPCGEPAVAPAPDRPLRGAADHHRGEGVELVEGGLGEAVVVHPEEPGDHGADAAGVVAEALAREHRG